ncbi:hypothetical protein [Sphingomonas sp. Leaf25]|uniref:hypothetical protein n=1 Tax=Sphingomonas sp. Leaf25 TaxID=1735692 RepID=UPI0006FE1ED5|nr:hypothetical protein [Sphingomonas sp. Leaf25]KQN05172.1 hypothetical protein ASE78_16745 [Sphingomonas sp. Leaf25]
MVRVRADAQNFRGPDGQRLAIGPGMTTDVNLIGDKRSVMAYILSPFTRLSEDASGNSGSLDEPVRRICAPVEPENDHVAGAGVHSAGIRPRYPINR